MASGSSDAESSEAICKVCRKECKGEDDEDDQVQCDKCADWYHFPCVGVDSSINDKVWKCESCVKAAGDSIVGTNVNSNLKKGIKSSNPSRVVQERQQHQATHNIAQNGGTTNNNNENPLKSSTPHGMGIESQSTTHSTNSRQVTAPQGQEAPERVNATQAELMLAMLEEERQANKEYLKKKYAILTQMSGAPIPQNSSIFEPFNALTSSQIAARQAIPRDLPSFSGDPEEWPAFISTYENSKSVAGYSDVENMLRLQKALKGKAYELVKDKLLVPSMVHEVLETLKLFFGRPEHILDRVVDKVRKMPPPKEKLESLIEYALAVRNICATMQTCNLNAHLANPMLVKELTDKLPNQHKLNWAMHNRDESVPIMTAFSDWLYRIAEAASTVVSPIASKSHRVNAHVEESVKGSCVVCKGKGHRVPECPDFKKLSYDDRWETTKKYELCRKCLKMHKGRCFSSKECGMDGCAIKHHPLLHKKRIEPAVDGATNSQAVVSAHQPAADKCDQLFRILPVKLYNGNECLQVFAFLDEGSSVTLLDEKIFRKLQLKGTSDPISLRWTNEMTRKECNSLRASIQVSAADSNRKFWLNDVHTVQNLSLPRQTINVTSLQEKYNHLTGIAIASYMNANPAILIGVNNWKLAVPRKLREGGWSEPIATKCNLGWSVQGASGNSKNEFVNVHSCSCDWQELHDAVKNSFNLESVASRTIKSHEESRSTKILDDTCKMENGKYEVGLLWTSDEIRLPESYRNSLNRANGLRKKMQRDESFKAVVNERVENLLTKGYAREVSEKELSENNERVWYLPIFVALNPNKPNKARLVWDAAAKAHDRSLNDFMMTGPDLLNPLCEVLMAFRVGIFAICGDIVEMFHRINIRDADMHAQRFLWWKDSDTDAPSIFVMRAMTFGIRCAPCIAHFVRNKNAEKFQRTHPRAYEAIRDAHYVDDFIDSMDQESDVIKLAQDVRDIHAAGNFIMRNWTSNSAEVVRSLQSTCNEIQAPVTLGDSEKVLGMCWDPNKDIIKFTFSFARLKRNVFCGDIMPTKREALQVLMSVFDPLGFLAPFTIGLKILLQKIWQLGCGWDDELPTTTRPAWQQWKRAMQHISRIEVPRCYSLILPSAACVQMHTFVDASEMAYAAVCYLRVQRGNEITVSLVAAKSKVAPIKPLSVPRLELQAAVIGARLAQKVINTRNLKLDEYVYWSDSKTVLRWMRMDPRGFNQFVMFRIGELLETTDANQWRWVPSKSNPADLATKVYSDVQDRTWLQGPAFLQQSDKDWPICTDIGQSDQSEMRKCVLHMHVTSMVQIFFEYFSDWRRLYRAIANWKLYLEKCRARSRKSSIPFHLTYEQLQSAKLLLYREAQRKIFNAEIRALEESRIIKRQSLLAPLNAYLDDNGVLRAQGRAKKQSCNADVIILPREHHVTFLIVKHFHELCHHISHETVINLIRSKFYISKLRVLYRTVRKNCQRCKIDNSTPAVPQMAPVPAARMASFERPFTYVGVDYFGPILVTVGRHKEKRWGVLYTCLTLRAVHLEVAYSLDTNSCIMCLRNFIARRGTPREIFSDNGTNFKATAKVIRDELKNVNFAPIEQKFDNIKWRFNPPGAPHMGGAWERLVRSVKTVLHRICPHEKFHDESLRHALCEVEFILNARPLTFVSLDAADDEALTPNHILLGSPDGEKVLCGDNSDLRSRWRMIQKFADKFWQRWVREYAPDLLRRGKWFNKRPPLRIGDIVVVVDETLSRNCWPKGVITDVVTASDGQVRRATVRTQQGFLVRPTAKIAVLDVGSNNDGRFAPALICEGEDVAAEMETCHN